VGERGAVALQEMVKNASTAPGGAWATLLSVLALLAGASGAVLALKDAMNAVWGVIENPDAGWWLTVRDRLLALAVVLGVGCLLLVSLSLSIALSAASAFAANYLPVPPLFAQLANVVVSLVVLTLLFAMLFKFLPDVRIAWREVAAGAVVTTVLFIIGKELLGWYLGRASVTSAYGAAGSLALLLLWTYYSAQIVLLGAEFTQVYAAQSGHQIEPSSRAIAITERELQQSRALEKQSRRTQTSDTAPVVVPEPWSIEPQESPNEERRGFRWGLLGFAAGWLLGKRGRSH
jgi:membrane protein